MKTTSQMFYWYIGIVYTLIGAVCFIVAFFVPISLGVLYWGFMGMGIGFTILGLLSKILCVLCNWSQWWLDVYEVDPE